MNMILMVALTVAVVGILTGCGANSLREAQNIVSSYIPGAGGNWTLRQTSEMAGNQMVYISPDGCKAVNDMLGVTYVAKAPSWNIIVYNNKNKVYFEATQEDWKKGHEEQLKGVEGMGKSFGYQETPYQKGKTATIAGLRAVEYVSESGSDRMSRIVGEDSRSGRTRTELWFTDEIRIPAQAGKVLATKSKAGIPSNGVLLRMVTESGDGTELIALDTVSCDRSAIPASIFTVPSGYQQVASEQAVVMGGAVGGAMNELYKQFAEPGTQKRMSKLMDSVEHSTKHANETRQRLQRGQLPKSSGLSNKDLSEFMNMLQDK